MANPTLIGSATEVELAGSQSTVITTTQNHTAGQLIVVAVTCQAVRTTGAMTDSVGNTYTKIVEASNTGDCKATLFRSAGSIALPSGGTISLQTTGISGGEVCMIAATVAPYRNVTDASNTATAETGDPTIGITTVAAKTISFACSGQMYSLAEDTYSGDADWTVIDMVGPDMETTVLLLTFAYRVRTSAGADTWTNAWDTSDVPWAAAVISMELIEGIDNLPILGVS